MTAQVLYLATVQASNTPDKYVENYLNTLFDRCKNGFVEIRQISAQGEVTREWISLTYPTLPAFPNDQHIYVGVATRKCQYGGGTKDDIEEIPAVWSDVDFKDINQDEVDKRIAAFPLPPSMIVNSGNGYHLYWILKTPAKIGDILKIEDINKRLVNHFGGDKGSVDAAHILRVPGTYNVKKNPKLVTVESYDSSKVYCIDDFDFLPPVEPAELPKPSSIGKTDEWYTQLLYGVRQGERHSSMLRLAGRYQTLGMKENETQALMAHWNERNQPPLSEDELSKTITDVFKRYKEDKVDGGSSQDFISVIESSVMSVPAFMRKSLPVKSLIIKPLLKQGEIIMISAARGVGKTWFALTLAFMATRHLSISNWETYTPTPTLYIDGEMSEDELQDRIYKLKIGRQMEQAPLYLLSSDQMRSNNKKPPNLNNPVWRSGISEYLKSHPDIGLVILDNLASLTPGRDENKKRDWDDINQWLLELRSKEIAVIFLHHEGKGGDQRGTSAIEDNINFSIRLKRPEGYHKEDGAKFIVEFTKTRRLYGDDSKSFILHLQYDGAVFDWKVLVYEEAKTENQIIKMLRDGAKQKDIAKTLGVTASWVSQIVKKAKDDEKTKRMKNVCGDDEKQAEDSPYKEEVEVVEKQN